MKLCKIRLKNFISHLDTEIDFEWLTTQYNTNFILISGATGSGKSAILDGLIAGLYGVGKHKAYIGNREPVCAYAPPDAKGWEVVVELILDGVRYRVRRTARSVRWEWKPLDGANGSFRQCEKPPVLPIQDAGFARKVMIIPQGEYLELLEESINNQQQRHLFRLLQIDWLDAFLNKMKERRRRLGDRLKGCSARVGEAIGDLESSVLEVKGVLSRDGMRAVDSGSVEGLGGVLIRLKERLSEGREQVGEDGEKFAERGGENIRKILNFSEIEDLVKEVQEKLQAVEQEAQERKADLEKKIHEREKKLQDVQRILARLQEVREIWLRAKRLERDREEMYAQYQKYTELKKIVELFQAYVHQLNDYEEQLQRLRLELERVRRKYKQLSGYRERLAVLWERVRGYEKAIQEVMTPLLNGIHEFGEALKKGEERHRQFQGVCVRMRQVEDAKRRVEFVEDLLEGLLSVPPDYERLKELRRKIDEAKQEIVGKQQEQNKLERERDTRKAALRQLRDQEEAIQRDLDQLKESVQRVERERQRYEAERRAIEEEYRKVIVAELVSQLREGEPCPICGSRVHPSPGASGTYSLEDLGRVLEERKRVLDMLQSVEQSILDIRKKIEDKQNVKNEIEKKIRSAEEELNQINMQYRAICSEIQQMQKNFDSLNRDFSKVESRVREQLKGVIQKLSARRSGSVPFGRTVPTEQILQVIVRRIGAEWRRLVESGRALGVAIGGQAELLDGVRSGEESGLTQSRLHKFKEGLELVKQGLEKRYAQLLSEREEYLAWRRGVMGEKLKELDRCIQEAGKQFTRVSSWLQTAVQAFQDERATKPVKSLLEGIHRCNRVVSRGLDLGGRIQKIFAEAESSGSTADWNGETDRRLFAQRTQYEKIYQELRKCAEGIQDAVKSLEEEYNGVRDKVEKLKGEIAEKENSWREVQGRLAEIRKQIQEKCKDEGIPYDLEEIRRKLGEVSKLSEWEERREEWGRERQSAVVALDAHLQELDRIWSLVCSQDCGVGSIPALTEEVRSRLALPEVDLRDYLDKVTRWLDALDQRARQKEEEFRAVIQDRQQERAQLERLVDQIKEKRNVFKERWEQLHRAIDALQQAHDDYRVFNRLYLRVGVDERQGQGLRKWLFQFIMKQMLRRASPYLMEFTEGRLVFVVREGQALDRIQILDYTYGKVRNVADLSGGEKFMAALALALGLTDLLLEFAGASSARPQFLFIDEGFGTLDTERLRKVVGALKQYAAKHDVLLGVISHRQEMHELAPVRIHVEHDGGRRGSRVRVIVQ